MYIQNSERPAIRCILALLGALVVGATSLGRGSYDGGRTEMLQNQILKIRICLIREVQKDGPLQPMCSQQFSAALVLSEAPRTDQNHLVLMYLMQEEQKQSARGRGAIAKKDVVDEETNWEDSTESLTRRKHAFEAIQCRGHPAAVV